MSEPVMWTTIKGKEGLVPLYTHPVDDTALLRQALEALKQVKPLYEKHDIIAALKERLGEKK